MATHSSMSSDRNQSWKYHVFLSFRGTDTRNNFTDHLFEALKSRGFIIFKDDEELPRGEVISEELEKAIEESLISIVILSKNYASSPWCLNELLKILESRERFSRKVFPIFYGVDTSTVRHQIGDFRKAFEKHEERFRDAPEKIQRWRDALKEVAGLFGQDSKNLRETKLIGRIVKAVWEKLTPELPTFKNGLVGIDSKIANMYSLLKIKSDDIRFIGIWGMGGIGKTTVASVVYNKICCQFEFCNFLRNIREESGERGHGLVHLQRKLLSPLKIEGIIIENTEQGKDTIRSLLRNRKVLLVLDDVSSVSQIESLAENEEWFGPGSRIIVTTRDSHILTSHGISTPYGIEILNKDESFQLFCQKAFKKKEPLEPNFWKLSNDVVQFAGGLPLALKVIGSVLHGRDISIWEDALNMLKKDPQFDIWKTLRISYDGLLDMKKTIFLDIACFFKGWQKDHLTQILEKCGFRARYGIEALIEKSLVTVDKNGNLGMHDLLEEMGRIIVYQECPNDASKRSRLWSLEDIDKVFRSNKGTESIQAVALNLSRPHEARWDPEVFSKMCNLRLLIATSGLRLPLGLKCLPSGLKVLIWSNYPLKSLPLEVPLDELVHLEMPNSKIDQLCIDSQSFSNLVSLNLGYSEDLIKTPNFAGIPNLKTLDLSGCINLVEVDPSIRLHRKLIEVNLKGCINLEKLPEKLEMSSLEILRLDGCSNVGEVPEFGENMVALSQLILDGTAIVELSPSLGSLTGLLTLSLNNCKNLICLPNTFDKLKSLTDLSIMGCLQISKLPYNLAKNEALQYLNALETSITELPSSIVHLKNLKCLYVEVLAALPPTFSSLGLLSELKLNGCNLRDGSILQSLGCLLLLEVLYLSFSNVLQLPCFSGLLKLRKVCLDYCRNLRSLPMLPPNIECLTARCCHNLMEISSDPQILSPLDGIDFEDDQIWLTTMTSQRRNKDFQSANNEEKFNGKDITMCDERKPSARNSTKSMVVDSLNNNEALECVDTDNFIDLIHSMSSFFSVVRRLNLRGSSLTDESIPQNLGFFSSLELLNLSDKDFVNLPNDCFSKLFKLAGLCLDNRRSLKSLPSFPPELVYVSLANCRSLESLPNLPPNVKYVSLDNCQNLKSLPNLPPKLECVLLNNCRSLKSLPSFPPKLVRVSLANCRSLESLPDLPPNVKFVLLHNCQNLKSLPNLPPNLVDVSLDNCQSLKLLLNLPPNVKYVSLDIYQRLEPLRSFPPKLVHVLLANCRSLESLPNLSSNLKYVTLDNCQSLKSLPNLPPNVQYVSLKNCQSFESLPNLPPNVVHVLLDNCQSLKSLLNLPPKLERVSLNNCRSLESLPNLPPNVKCVFLDNCQSLKSLPKLPTNAVHVTALNCCSMKPPADQYQRQILGVLAASIESKYLFQATNPLKLEGVFYVPGAEIPLWFDNQNYFISNKRFSIEKHVDAISITVDIPDNCYKSECWGIALCLVIQDMVPSDISGGCLCCGFELSGAEKKDCSVIGSDIEFLEGPHLLIFYCRGRNWLVDESKQLTLNFEPPFRGEIKKCGYRVISKEDAQAWRNTMTSQCRIEELQSSNDEENQLDGKDVTSYDAEANQPAAKPAKLN